MALYHKWDDKNGFAYMLTFFSLISDVLVGVIDNYCFLAGRSFGLIYTKNANANAISC
jgi:hypothetical protein